MDTTVHQHLPSTPAPLRAATVRLGVVVSLVGAVAAVVLRWTTHVSDFAIVAAVVVVGFTLSWRATRRAHPTRS
jgi:hypothetical protein